MKFATQLTTQSLVSIMRRRAAKVLLRAEAGAVSIAHWHSPVFALPDIAAAERDAFRLLEVAVELHRRVAEYDQP